MPSLDHYLELSKTLPSPTLIALTQYLFEKYFLPSQTQNNAGIKANWKLLSVVTLNGDVLSANQVYLAEPYQPKVCLQAYIDTFHYLSLDYMNPTYTPEILDYLKKFFLTIGVTESIKPVRHDRPINLNELSKMGALAVAYSGMLQTEKTRCYFLAKHPVYGYSPGEINSMRSSKYHLMTGFYTISHIDRLYESPHFLRIMSQMTMPEPTVYETSVSKRDDIPSNIHFYVGKKVHGITGKYPSQLYTTRIVAEFDGLWNSENLVATIMSHFSNEFQKHYGFKQVISAVHLKEIFEGIVARNPRSLDVPGQSISMEFRKTYTALLHQIAYSYRSNPTEFEGEHVRDDIRTFFKNAPLLNRAGVFRPAKRLFCTQDETLETPDARHALVWFSPEFKSDLELYTALLNCFGLTTLKLDDFSPVMSSEIDVNPTLKNMIIEKLPFILFRSAHEQGETDFFSENMKEYSKDIISRVHSMKINGWNKLTIAFNTLEITVKVWFNEQLNCIYYDKRYIHTEGLLDIAKALTKMLRTSFTPNIMWGLLINSAEELFSQFTEYGISIEILEHLEELIQECISTEALQAEPMTGAKNDSNSDSDDTILKRLSASPIELMPQEHSMPESLPSTATEAQTHTQPQSQAESRAQSRAQSQVQSQAEARAQSQAESRAEAKGIRRLKNLDDDAPQLSTKIARRIKLASDTESDALITSVDDTSSSPISRRGSARMSVASILARSKATAVDVDQVSEKSITAHHPSPLGLSPRRVSKTREDSALAQEFGELGERCVFEHMKQVYTQKHPDKDIVIAENSITVSSPGYREVFEWRNATFESGDPYDFVITIEKKMKKPVNLSM